jgi:hypothetical protein
MLFWRAIDLYSSPKLCVFGRFWRAISSYSSPKPLKKSVVNNGMRLLWKICLKRGMIDKSLKLLFSSAGGDDLAALVHKAYSVNKYMRLYLI